MRLTRLFATAAAAALIAGPVFAAGETPDAATAPAAAPVTPALPSIPRVTPGANVYDTLKASGQFTILVKALDATNVAGVLKTHAVTFFAPTDAAFNALPPDQLARLMAPGDAAANQLQKILTFYIINTQVDSSKIKGAKGPVATVEGQGILLDGSNPDDMLVGGADIIQADIRTTDGGIIHVIDRVIAPPDSPYAAELAAPAPAAAAPAAAAPTGG